MSKFNTNVVYKVTKEAKGKDLELGNLYFLNVPVTYAKVLEPAKKFQSEDTAYQLNLFINADTMEKLEEIGINKEFSEVGVTKIKKGANRGKIKYSLELEANAPYEGMFAAQFGRDTVKRDKDGAVTKEYTPLKVVDAKGQPFSQEVGNGSVCDIKMFAYRNADGMLVVMLDTVVVKEHVVYNREDGESFDDVLGIAVQNDVKTVSDNPVDDFPTEDDVTPTSTKKTAQKAVQEATETDPDCPF